MSAYQLLTHEFEPVYDEDRRILILGSFPSVKSRETHFYYGHPQTRFRKILAAVYETPLPGGIPEKKAFLPEHGIALCAVCRLFHSSL